MLRIFVAPRTLSEAYGLATVLVRSAGIFPYYYDLIDNRFHLSWKLFLLTVFHVAIYVYANITLLLDDWRDYVQPLVGTSTLAAVGNLSLRLLGIIITFSILGPVLFGSKGYLMVLNISPLLVAQCGRLGIDVLVIYRRLYLYSWVLSLCQLGTVIITSWHSVFFYERITGHEPTLKYYIVVVLSNFYKIMFLFYVIVHLVTIYILSSEMNAFLQRLVEKERKRYESEHSTSGFVKIKA